MKRTIFAVVVGFLSATSLMAGQGDPVDWQRLQRLDAGSEIHVAVAGGVPAKVRLLYVDDSMVVTLKRTDPKLSASVERVLLDVGPKWPALLEGLHQAKVGDVSVSRDGIFDGTRKLADLPAAVQQARRADITALSWRGGAFFGAFDQVGLRVKPGDKVWVTDVQGRHMEGTVMKIEPTSLVLSGKNAGTIPAADVRELQVHIPDPVTDGLAVGALFGLLGGLVLAAGDANDEGIMEAGPAIMLGLAVGAGAGLGIDAARTGKRETVYRAPGIAVGRVSVAPVVTPRTRALAISFSF